MKPTTKKAASKKFTATKKALKAYDHTRQQRLDAWSKCKTNDDVKRAQEIDKEANEKVGRALYEDTREFNKLENCLLVNPDGEWIRKLVK